jgi:hypothetical protein
MRVYIKIVSRLPVGYPTKRISHFVDYHLQLLVHKLPSFVKDTIDLVKKLLTIGNFPANSLLVTLDVSSLYTNIPHNEGINACDHFYVPPLIIPFPLAHSVTSFT